MFAKDHTLNNVDPELWAAIQNENTRQQDHIELIASENYTSPAVMQAQGSQLTNKYAEGYPGKRYYGGCEYVDVVEQLAIDRIKQLFGAEAANVQPNSGSQANQGVFFAMLKPGDTIMGMSLAEGGHLTHGMALNMSGKWFNVVSYGLTEKEDIDYDAMERLAKRRVIVLTPNGFVPQEPGGTAHNPWMAHRCGWTVEELRRRGYRVRGYSGWKGGAGPGWWIRNNVDALFQLLMTATQPLVADRPHLAFHLLAWKDVEAVR